MAPELQAPVVPAGEENWVWRKTILLLGQLLKAVPVQIVLPNPETLHS